MVISLYKRIKNLKLSKTTRRLPKKYYAYFFQTLGELLKEGFSLHQGLSFLLLLLPQEKEVLTYLIDNLGQGQSFEKVLHQVGLPFHIVSNIFYAQRQGCFVETLIMVAAEIKRADRYKEKLLKALAYPLVMLVFLIALLFGMRTFILPHIVTFISQEMYEENIHVRILLLFFNFLPQGMLVMFSLFLVFYFSLDAYLRRQTHLRRIQWLQQTPLKRWVRQWVTYMFSRQLAYFYAAGYSIQQILHLMLQYPMKGFLTELAGELEEKLLEGTHLPTIIADMNIFTKEFPLMLQQGELTSQTAQKCQVYAEKVFSDLLTDVSRKISYIQPFLFMVIALLVMAMYLLMMLPMLTMEGL